MHGGGSQGGQDAKLTRILGEIGVANGTFVEFGYTGTSTSNTVALRRRGWHWLLLDGHNSDKLINLHAERITSSNIVRLFRQHGVSIEVDYVSIDIDSFDLWVLRALLASEFRPRVLTVEYNSNFPYGSWLAFPDPQIMDVPPGLRHWGGNCYMGSSASALHAVAVEGGYEVVDVEPGLDLFLVRRDLWAGRAVPDLSQSPDVYRPFNVQLDGAMKPYQQQQYLDYREYTRTRGNLTAARQAGAKTLAALARRGVPCLAGACPPRVSEKSRSRGHRIVAQPRPECHRRMRCDFSLSRRSSSRLPAAKVRHAVLVSLRRTERSSSVRQVWWGSWHMVRAPVMRREKAVQLDGAARRRRAVRGQVGGQVQATGRAVEAALKTDGFRVRACACCVRAFRVGVRFSFGLWVPNDRVHVRVVSH